VCCVAVMELAVHFSIVWCEILDRFVICKAIIRVLCCALQGEAETEIQGVKGGGGGAVVSDDEKDGEGGDEDEEEYDSEEDEDIADRPRKKKRTSGFILEEAGEF